jgi:hypothetical protein
METGNSYWAGIEALMTLVLLEGPSFLEDAATDYGDGLDSMDAAQLFSLIKRAKKLLGGRLLEASSEAPALVITRDYRIFMGKRSGPEIRMRPMTKAVFLLFLRHPEGIAFGQVGQYRAELEHFYRRVSRSGTNEEIGRSLDRVLDAASREVNVAASRAAEALAGMLEEEYLPSYVIAGERGGPKRISLDRRLVVWL